MRKETAPFLRLSLPCKVLFVTVGACLLLATGCNRGKSAADGKPQGNAAAGQRTAANSSMTITTTPVRNEQIVRTVPATGSIFPWQEVIVGSEVGGYRVAAVLVDVGSRVLKGQPLVKLSEDMLQADVATRLAALR